MTTTSRSAELASSSSRATGTYERVPERIAGPARGVLVAEPESVTGRTDAALPASPERTTDATTGTCERRGDVPPTESRPDWKTRIVALLEPGRSKSTIAVLDGVRAFACLLVVSYHISLITRDTHAWFPGEQTFVAALLLAGGAGVTLFFVLSGFLLFLPYARALLQESAWPSARRFYLRRALRIIPAYYICLFTLVLLEHREYLQPDHWQQLALFLIFFMDSSNATFEAINGPFWTLAVEWQFYLLLPLLVLGMRAVSRQHIFGRRWLALLLSLLTLSAWGALSQSWNSSLQVTSWANNPLWQIVQALFFGQSGKYLQDFAIGMLVALLYTTARQDERWKKVLRQLRPWFWYSGLALLLFMALWHENAAHNNGQFWLDGLKGAYSLCGELGFACGFGLCVLALLHGRARSQRFFSLTPLRLIGNVSYSTYMWHLPLLLFFMTHIGYSIATWNSWLVFGSYWLWVVLTILPFSVIMFLLTERPGMSLARKV